MLRRVSSLSAELSCSFHVSPFSLLRIIISRSLPRTDAKCGMSIKTGLKLIYLFPYKLICLIFNVSEGYIFFIYSLNLSHVIYPKNLAATGPISIIRVARASPSISGGGFATLFAFTSLHVTRIGMVALRGGTMMRTPLCLHPFMAPPRASTRKLTKNL